MAQFTSEGWTIVGELRGLPVSARRNSVGEHDFAILGPEIALEYRLLAAGSPGYGGSPLATATWAVVAPHPDGSGYTWVQGIGEDGLAYPEAAERDRRQYLESYFARYGRTRRFGYGVGINECYNPDPNYRYSRMEDAGKALAGVASETEVPPLGPAFPGPEDLTEGEVAHLVRLNQSLRSVAGPIPADARPEPEMALVVGSGPYDALAEAEGTPVYPGPYGRPDRTCVECGSPVYGDYCAHCHEG